MQVRIGVMDIKARDRILKSVDIVRQLESRPDVVALAAAEMSKSIGLEAIQASENRAVMSLDGLLGRAIEEFVGLVGKGEVEGMTASGESAEDAALRAKAAKSCMEMLGMMRQKVIETAKHEIHEVQPHYDTQLRLLRCPSSYSRMSCNAQAGTDTLAALVARTIAAAKLKVQASVARAPHYLRLSAPSHRGCIRKRRRRTASTRCCSTQLPLKNASTDRTVRELQPEGAQNCARQEECPPHAWVQLNLLVQWNN